MQSYVPKKVHGPILLYAILLNGHVGTNQAVDGAMNYTFMSSMVLNIFLRCSASSL